MARKLSRLQLQDPAATRAHDQLCATLNPLLEKLGAATVKDSTASTVADLRADFNALLAVLRTAGVLG